MSIFAFGTSEARKWLEKDRAAHRDDLSALEAGRWPEGPAGRMISALAERLGTEKAQRVHRYWEVLTWLVLQAEDAMIEEADGDVAIDRLRIEAAFAELASLKASMGRGSFTALRPLLPFSRNDYWELAELRQRLGG
jgi:hypothetical protein